MISVLGLYLVQLVEFDLKQVATDRPAILDAVERQIAHSKIEFRIVRVAGQFLAQLAQGDGFRFVHGAFLSCEVTCGN